MTRFSMYFNANLGNGGVKDCNNEDIFSTTGLTRNIVDALKVSIAETVLAFSEFGDNGNVISVSDAARLRRIWDRVATLPKKYDDRGLREKATMLLTEVSDIHMACLSRKNAGYRMPEEVLSLAAGYIQPVFEFIRNELEEK